jgi:hypothetical protein
MTAPLPADAARLRLPGKKITPEESACPATFTPVFTEINRRAGFP